MTIVDVKKLNRLPTHMITDAILPESPDVFIVNDGRQDVRFFSNPLITGPPFIRFYAGAALFVDDVKVSKVERSMIKHLSIVYFFDLF